MEWKISRRQGKCITCEVELNENDVFYSALLDSGEELSRKDFCPTCWETNQEEVFSFWKTRVPASDAPKQTMVDDEVLFDFFQRLEDEPEAAKVNFRFLLGLMLMRKKILKFEDIDRDEEQEFLILRQTGAKERHRVLDPQLSEEELDKLKDDLHGILYLEG